MGQLLSHTSGVEMFASFGLLCLAGATLAAPLLDTPEVVEAKGQFIAAFETAREGKHAALAPVNNDIQAAQIANAYLDDTAPVSEAKLNFKIAFDTAEAGGLMHMQAEPIANFYIAKAAEVAEAEDLFMKQFTAAEKGEHVMYAPVNNDIQAEQIENAYIPYTQEVVDAEAAPAAAVVVETAPAVAAVKSAPAVVAVVA